MVGVGVVAPFVGAGGVVVADGEDGDLVFEVLAGGEVAAAQDAAGQGAEPLLDHVEPTGVLGGVGDAEAGVGGQPGTGGPGSVGGAVVHDEVDAQGGVGAAD